MNEIKRTPFWLLFDALYMMGDKTVKKRCSKNEDNIRQIMFAYDELSESFMIIGQQLNPGKRDVELIFGVYSGSQKIPLKSREYEIPSWVRRYFGEDIGAYNGPYVLYKNIVFDKLKSKLAMDDRTSFRDMARLTHCYLLSSVFVPNQNESMFDKIGNYDWGKFIVYMLRAQIMSTKNLKVGGCAILLPVRSSKTFKIFIGFVSIEL
ncbi:hypothetical protein ACS0TY_031481 [Phlomoides rotata]